MFRPISFAGALLACALLAACGEAPATNEPQDHAEAKQADYERGPHRGRMLRDGDFAVEMMIFEDGVEPVFHVYAYRDDKSVAPSEVGLSVELSRLGGRIARRATPSSSYSRRQPLVRELTRSRISSMGTF